MKLLRMACALALAAAPIVVASSANAQPRDHRGDQDKPAQPDKDDKSDRDRRGDQKDDQKTDHRDDQDRDHRNDTPTPTPAPQPQQGDTRDHRPHEAPPSAKDEAHPEKAGYIWQSGRWDWKDDKWTWLDGHYERARAGKRWSAGRWDKDGDSYAWHDGRWDDDNGATGPNPGQPDQPTPNGNSAPPPDNGQGGRPHAAPPPPRPETHGSKDGYVWAGGRWDWKDNQWAWLDGHWERAQANKRWRDGRWDKDGDSYSWNDGGWDEDNNPDNAGPGRDRDHDDHGGPGPRGGPPPRDHRQDWKLERPTVSGYWPAKGKAGTRVTIKGENFGADATVTWNGQPIRAAKTDRNQIVIEIPGDASGVGTLAFRGGRDRDSVIGSFEVAASYDAAAAAAEATRIAAQQRKDAEAAWAARQKGLAKDKAAREAALQQRIQERESTRDDRRASREAEIRAQWERDFLADADTQDELTLHAQRLATIQRMQDLAETTGDGDLVVRISVTAQRENDRHDNRMAALHASFGTK